MKVESNGSGTSVNEGYKQAHLLARDDVEAYASKSYGIDGCDAFLTADSHFSEAPASGSS